MMTDGNMLKTIQPFLVMENVEFFQYVYARDGISHFYTFTPKEAQRVVMVPSGCMDILFEYDKDGLLAYVLGATVTHYNYYNWHANRYFGVRFKSGYWPAFLKSSNKEMIDNKVLLSELVDDHALFKELEGMLSFQEQVELFLSVYNRLFVRKERQLAKYEIVKKCKTVIYESKGLVRIDELEEGMGYTARYLNKLFEQEVGCSPKSYCKLVRFQNVLEYLNLHPDAKFVDLAIRFGYYDQSQLNREFVQFTGKTPREYKKYVNSDKYFRKVINVPIFTRNVQST